MIVAIGDVSGSQRRVRRQLGMSEGYLAGRAEPDTHPQGELLAASAQRSGVTASVIGYGLAGDPLLLQPPAQLIDGAGMVPARIVKTGVRLAVKAT